MTSLHMFVSSSNDLSGYVCLNIWPYQSIYFYWFFYLSICLSVCLCDCLCVCLTDCLCVCIFIYLSIYLSICVSIHLSIYLSIYLCAYLCIYLCVCWPVWPSACVPLSILYLTNHDLHYLYHHYCTVSLPCPKICSVVHHHSKASLFHYLRVENIPR